MLDLDLCRITTGTGLTENDGFVCIHPPTPLKAIWPQRFRVIQTTDTSLALYLPQKIAKAFEYAFRIKNEDTKSKAMMDVAKVTAHSKDFGATYISILFMSNLERREALISLAHELINAGEFADVIGLADEIKGLDDSASILLNMVSELCEKNKFKEAREVAEKIDSPLKIKRKAYNFIVKGLAKCGKVEDINELMNSPAIFVLTFQEWAKALVEALVNKGDFKGAREKIDFYLLEKSDRNEALIYIIKKLTEQHRLTEAIRIIKNEIQNVDIQSNKCTALIQMANILIGQGDIETLLLILYPIIQATDISVEDRESALETISQALACAHFFDQAMQVADKITQLSHLFCNAYCTIVLEMIKRQKYEEACKITKLKLLLDKYNSAPMLAKIIKELLKAKRGDLASQVIDQASAYSQVDQYDHGEIVERFATIGLFDQAISYAKKYLSNPALLSTALLKTIQQMVEYNELERAQKIAEKLPDDVKGQAFLMILRKIVQKNIPEALEFAKKMHDVYALPPKDVCEAFSLIACEQALNTREPLLESLETNIKQTLRQEELEHNPQLIEQTMQCARKAIAEGHIKKGRCQDAKILLEVHPQEQDVQDNLLAQMALQSARQE